MNIRPGTYIFECELMPWTEYELGIDKQDNTIEVALELSIDEIQSIVDYMHWAWDNDWFEHSMSETVLTELFIKHSPALYERIQPLALQKFCNLYPNSENVNGFGEFEIFPPEEFIDIARETYQAKENS